jgi:hypothetical protein
MIFHSRKKNGYSLVEMIIYVTILSVFTWTIINTVLSLSESYRTLLALRIVDNTGITAMERMTRDIRAASSVDTTNSTLGSNPGVLTLIDTANGVSTTTKFYIASGTLKVDVNSVYDGPLSDAGVTITNLVFRQLTSSTTAAVKIDMTVQGVDGPITETKSYHSTVILGGV